MDLNLRGEVAFITGGSKGIGFACAAALAAEGAKVAISSRSQDNIDKALAKLPGAAFGIAADMSDAAAAAAAIDAVESHFGPIDILVNSAGAARRATPDELTPAVWRAAMDAKYFSYINAIDPLVKRMAKRGRGVIVNIIGAGGKVASPTHLAGGAANAALMLVTAGLGSAYASRGVRVVGLNPGLTDTDRVAEGLESAGRLAGVDAAEARRRAIEIIPIGRMAAPEEIANAVAFLASGKASYITGVTIGMDGGQYPIVA
jgi:NAD(P)-dependent dehydrogenase (short-subunit alcohol dehydrogenase family)